MNETDAGRSGTPLDRRAFLGLTGISMAAFTLGIAAPADAAAATTGPVPADPFQLGVASGDPEPTSVVLWTRLAPRPLAEDGHGGMPRRSVDVHYEVAEDERFTRVVRRGRAVATPELAHAVHPEVRGLRPGREYFYRFRAGNELSPAGRTRTAPGRHDRTDRLTFGMASCQAWYHGHFTAYRHLAAEDLDLVLFLGDYVYEYAINANNLWREGVQVGKVHDAETQTLEQYRLRYALFKTDPHLMAAHAAAPWVVTWDDHEVQNNYAGAAPGAPAELRARRAAAYQAYYEHMPVRMDQPDPSDGGRVTLYRDLAWGTLARFYVLDGRQYRSDQACDAAGDLGSACPAVEDDGRTMLGAEQERWLGEALDASDTRWNVLAQQVIVSKIAIPVGSSEVLNLDQWDGYGAARRRLAGQLAGVSNPLIITGDIHASGVGVVTRDPDDGASDALAAELVGTSISSDFPAGYVDIVEHAGEVAPAIRYVNARRRGYVVCEVTEDEVRADFRYVSTVTEASADIETGATWIVRDGDPEPTRA